MFARPSLLRMLGSDLALALGPAITAALYIFFFTQALGFTRTQTNVLLLIYIAAGLLGAPTWALVARRLGKHQTVMLGCVLYGFAQAHRVRHAARKHGADDTGHVLRRFRRQLLHTS